MPAQRNAMTERIISEERLPSLDDAPTGVAKAHPGTQAVCSASPKYYLGIYLSNIRAYKRFE
jgi:hypothetical protein